jgi:pilus assembly protein Flp/PilA
MIKMLTNFFKDEEGATMVEYALMLALIAVVCIGAVTVIGNQANTTFGTSGNALSTANAAGS